MEIYYIVEMSKLFDRKKILIGGFDHIITGIFDRMKCLDK